MNLFSCCRNKRFASLTAAGLLLGGSGAGPLAPRPAAAQDAPPSVRVGQNIGGRARQPAPEAPPIDTLARALDLVAWSADTAGPLLALDVQNVRPWQPKPDPEAPPEERWRSPQPLPPPTPGRSLRLNVVAPYFGRKVMRLDTLTVIAPAEMVVLNANPGKGDPLAGMRREERIRTFAGSLSRDQWQQLASPRGLGAGDMTSEQRALFLSLLPQPFQIQKMVSEPSPNGGGERLENTITLTPAQKAQVRLRINRSVSLSFPARNEANSYYGFGSPPRRNRGLGGVAAGPDGDPAAAAAAEEVFYRLGYTNEWEPRAEAYGVTIRREVPNRPKPGHLRFDAPALGAAVSLLPDDAPQQRGDGPAPAGPVAAGGPPATGATAPAPGLTVATLLGRAAQATGLELMADRRVAALPVWTRGDSARAGDVLKALCLAVTGTFRKVGPVYLLTDDVEGIATRRAQLADWAQDVSASGNKAREALDKRIRDMQPGKLLDFAPGDPFALDAAGLKRLQDARRVPPRPGAPDPSEIPLSDLPPALGNYLRTELARGQWEWITKNARTDRVRLEVQSRMNYVVPGVGDLEDANLYLYNIPALEEPAGPPPMPEPPPFTFAPTMNARTLYVSPKDETEVARAIGEARRRGLTHLWVTVPDGEKGAALLAASAKAGKAAGLYVFGVVRLLRLGAAESSGEADVGEADASDANKSAAATSTADGSAAGAETVDAANAPAEPATPARNAAPDGGALDVNALGETNDAYVRRRLRSLAGQGEPWRRDALRRARGDWLRPDAPAGAREPIRRRLLALAATPGLTGLVLRDTAAPGYEDPGETERNYWSSDAPDLGYAGDNRLAFLRQESIDPIDLVASPINIGNANVDLPFFSEQAFQPRMIEQNGQWVPEPGRKSPVQTWRAFRYEKNKAFLGELHTALKRAFPDLALVIQERSGVPWGETWYGTWDKPDALPRRPANFDGPNQTSAVQVARSYSRRILLSAVYRAPAVPDPKWPARRGFAFTLGYLMENHKRQNWDGIVFDLSEDPLDKVLPALAALDPAPPAAPAATDTAAR